jgi:AcrR family transcriptional regulator
LIDSRATGSAGAAAAGLAESRSTSSRRRGAALEDAILDAAYAELSAVGYTAFTVEGVAARAHTGKASIYRRWPTKNELVLDTLCDRLPSPQECGFDPQLADDVTTEQALRLVAAAIVRIINSPAGDAMRAVKCEALADPQLAQTIDDRFQAPRRATLIALLERGIARGEVRPGAASDIVADVLPAMITHRLIMERATITEESIAEIFDEVLLPLIAAR